VFVLVFARPELIQARPGFGAGRSRTMLTLDPLDPASMDALVDALVPGMATAARAAVTSHAQGLPLFAVETIRALIDRDIVQPSEGVYRLVGDIGQLQVPGSLRALLAARLDALDPQVRQLVADAAVLGTTFPAEALIGVSVLDEPTVRAGLAELLRREVLAVSADPLSPERGSYRFTQDMLQQVAYDILSRRDRKARHLAVADHLRSAFPEDGEEVADVIARHYLDALEAVPDDPDTGQIRGQAIATLIKAAERADRTGAATRAGSAYAAAARHSEQEATVQEPDAGELWELAARADIRAANYDASAGHAGHAHSFYLRHGRARDAARAQSRIGNALQAQGRHTEAREQIVAALEILQPEPDTDTVRALLWLADLEVFQDSPEADRITTEALVLGQGLGVDANLLLDLLTIRGIYLGAVGRRTESAAYLREAALLAEQRGDNMALGGVLLNLADNLSVSDPAASAEIAQAAVEHLRRTGHREGLIFATANLIAALLLLGHWDAADGVLTKAVDYDGLGDSEFLACYRAWLDALSGEADAAQAALAGLEEMRANENAQEKAELAVVEGLAAAAQGQPGNALTHARRALNYADVLGMNAETMRWAWPLAIRAIKDLGDTATAEELIAELSAVPPGHVAPMLRAERDLARARLADRADDPAAGAALLAAIASLREHSTPYHVAHGLLDHAEHLERHGDSTAAALAVGEARDIAQKLRCQPLLDRADALSPARTGAGT